MQTLGNRVPKPAGINQKLRDIMRDDPRFVVTGSGHTTAVASAEAFPSGALARPGEVRAVAASPADVVKDDPRFVVTGSGHSPSVGSAGASGSGHNTAVASAEAPVVTGSRHTTAVESAAAPTMTVAPLRTALARPVGFYGKRFQFKVSGYEGYCTNALL